jgi:ATP-dependent Lon protease
MYKESKTYLTAAVTALVVAILFSLTAILVRSVVAMDGNLAANGTVLELRKSVP